MGSESSQVEYAERARATPRHPRSVFCTVCLHVARKINNVGMVIIVLTVTWGQKARRSNMHRGSNIKAHMFKYFGVYIPTLVKPFVEVVVR